MQGRTESDSLIVGILPEEGTQPEHTDRLWHEKTIWERNRGLIVMYAAYCLLAALPTAVLVLWHAKDILPSQVKDMDDLKDKWRDSDASDSVALFRFSNSLIMNWLFNLKYFDQAFITVIQQSLAFPKLGLKERLAFLSSIVFALMGGVTFGAIAYSEFEFVPEVAVFFFVLNFTAYFSPRLQAVYNLLIKIGDEQHAFLKELKMFVARCDMRQIPHPNFSQAMSANAWGDALLQSYQSLIRNTIADPSVLASKRYGRAAIRLLDKVASSLILYPILAPYAQRGLKGLNILFNFSEDDDIYTSPLVILGYMMAFSSYVFYFRCFSTTRAATYDYGRYLWDLIANRFFKEGILLSTFAIAIAVMCTLASGGIENIYHDTLAKGYVDYFPLLIAWKPLWDVMTYSAGVSINYVSNIHLLLEWACVSDQNRPELFNRAYLMRQLKHGGFFKPNGLRLLDAQTDYIRAEVQGNSAPLVIGEPQHYSFFAAQKRFHNAARSQNQLWTLRDWLNPRRHHAPVGQSSEQAEAFPLLPRS